MASGIAQPGARELEMQGDLLGRSHRALHRPGEVLALHLHVAVHGGDLRRALQDERMHLVHALDVRDEGRPSLPLLSDALCYVYLVQLRLARCCTSIPIASWCNHQAGHGQNRARLQKPAPRASPRRR